MELKIKIKIIFVTFYFLKSLISIIKLVLKLKIFVIIIVLKIHDFYFITFIKWFFFLKNIYFNGFQYLNFYLKIFRINVGSN